MAIALRQCAGQIVFQSRGVGFEDVTRNVASWLDSERVSAGLLHVFIQHTSASLTIQENADPDVQLDLTDALHGLAPELSSYRHNSEGADDMPAHIKAMLTSTDLTVPVRNGKLALGTWQGIYLIEHRAHPHQRTLQLTYQGT